MRDGEKYVEEVKLRVLLVSPPNSPVISPKDGESKQEQCHETSIHKNDSQVTSGLEKVTPHLKVHIYFISIIFVSKSVTQGLVGGYESVWRAFCSPFL